MKVGLLCGREYSLSRPRFIERVNQKGRRARHHARSS